MRYSEESDNSDKLQRHQTASGGGLLTSPCPLPSSLPQLPTTPPDSSSRSLTRGQRLLELVGLVGVGNAQGVEVAAAADLELGHLAALLDLHGGGILPPGGEEELLNLLNLLGLQKQGEGRRGARGDEGDVEPRRAQGRPLADIQATAGPRHALDTPGSAGCMMSSAACSRAAQRRTILTPAMPTRAT